MCTRVHEYTPRPGLLPMVTRDLHVMKRAVAVSRAELSGSSQNVCPGYTVLQTTRRKYYTIHHCTHGMCTYIVYAIESAGPAIHCYLSLYVSNTAVAVRHINVNP
jgi:hypothetical protein